MLTPGMMTFSMSCMTSCHFSAHSGASAGSRGRKYPGSTVGTTRLENSSKEFMKGLQIVAALYLFIYLWSCSAENNLWVVTMKLVNHLALKMVCYEK